MRTHTIRIDVSAPVAAAICAVLIALGFALGTRRPARSISAPIVNTRFLNIVDKNGVRRIGLGLLDDGSGILFINNVSDSNSLMLRVDGKRPGAQISIGSDKGNAGALLRVRSGRSDLILNSPREITHLSSPRGNTSDPLDGLIGQ